MPQTKAIVPPAPKSFSSGCEAGASDAVRSDLRSDLRSDPRPQPRELSETAAAASPIFDPSRPLAAESCDSQRRAVTLAAGDCLSELPQPSLPGASGEVGGPPGVGNSVAADARDRDSERVRSYDRIVQAAVSREWFLAAEVREAVGLESRLVNQVLRMLSEDGWLVKIDSVPGESVRGEACGPGAALEAAALEAAGLASPESIGGAARGSSRMRARRGPAFRWTEKRDQLAPAEWVRSKIYTNRVKRAPLEDRPRERLLANGAASLRTADLIAILIRSGNARESAVQAGERIAAAFAAHLETLSDARRGDLRELSSAVGETAYCQILAGVELGRRVAEARAKVQPRPRIQSTDDAREFCRQHFRRLASDARHEEFHIVLLNTRYEPIGSHRVSSGTLDASLVHPREVFRPAIKEAAKAILLVHNHPSGDPTPGEQDIRVTRRLNEVAKLMGIDVLDHIVVAAQGCCSLRDAGLGFD